MTEEMSDRLINDVFLRGLPSALHIIANDIKYQISDFDATKDPKWDHSRFIGDLEWGIDILNHAKYILIGEGDNND